MITFLKKLLSKKSISPKDMGCQTLISNKLKKIGFDCYKLDKKNTSNLWATYGSNNPIFCFGKTLMWLTTSRFNTNFAT